MTKESEVEKTARFTRHLLKGILVFILVIVIIVGVYVGIVMHFFASITTTNSTPTPNSTSAKYTIYLSGSFRFNVATKFQLGFFISNALGNEDISFSTADISYNGRLGNTYGNFAPQLLEYMGMTHISGYTVRAGYMGSFEIDLPEGAGGPWVSGMTVIIAIQTNTQQGSTAITLP